MTTVARIFALVCALLALAVAFVSPLDELAEQLLSAHMAQHLLLMIVAAPLLVWARPVPHLLRSLPSPLRLRVSRAGAKLQRTAPLRALQHPLAAGTIFCVTLAFWHLPAVYRWMLASELRHVAMHLTFLASAGLFWLVALDPADRHRDRAGARILLVLSTALITGLPAAALTFAGAPLYRGQTNGPLPFNLTTLQDQQLAGLLMWIPMDLALFCVAAALLRSWLGSSGRTEPVS